MRVYACTQYNEFNICLIENGYISYTYYTLAIKIASEIEAKFKDKDLISNLLHIFNVLKKGLCVIYCAGRGKLIVRKI